MADKTIHEIVAEQLAGIGPNIAQEVALQMADREVKKRATTLIQGLDRKSELEKNYAKLRPDNVQFNETGEKISETFSKAKHDERVKARAQLDKLEKAIVKAYGTGDYGDLNNILGSGKGDKSKGGAEDSGTPAGDPPAEGA